MNCEVCGHDNEPTAELCFVCGFAFRDGIYKLVQDEDGNVSTNRKVIETSTAFIPASPISRFFAYWVDTILFVVVVYSVKTIANLIGYPLINKDLLVPLTLLLWSYFTLSEISAKQGTLGKQMFNIRVVDVNGQRLNFSKAAFRNILKVVFIGMPYLRYVIFLTVFVSDRKRALHDFFSQSFVVEQQQVSVSE